MINYYGYCPICGAEVISRERRPNGNDRCEKGHTIASVNTLTPKQWEDLNND